MPSHVLYELEIASTLFACVFCLVKGGLPERWGSGAILVSYVVADIIIFASRPEFPTKLIFACDFTLAFTLLVVAVRYGSLWLGCAMMLQAVIMCSEGMSFGGDGLNESTQKMLNDSLSMAMLACVVASTVLSWRRRVRARYQHNSHLRSAASVT